MNRGDFFNSRKILFLAGLLLFVHPGTGAAVTCSELGASCISIYNTSCQTERPGTCPYATMCCDLSSGQATALCSELGGTCISAQFASCQWGLLGLCPYATRCCNLNPCIPTSTCTAANTCAGSTCTNNCGTVITGTKLCAPTATLSASDSPINSGQFSILRWESTSAISCTASSSDNSWKGSVALTGSVSVTPGSTTTYSIFCANSAGVLSPVATTTVSVNPPGGPVIDFKVSPATINPGENATLTWTVTGAASCRASSTDTTWSGAVNANNGTKGVAPSLSTDYTISCTNSGGIIAERKATLVVFGASCNNGILNQGEQCDDGNSNGVCPSRCSRECKLNVCGAGSPSIPTCTFPALCKSACSPNEERDGFCGVNSCCKPVASTTNNGTITVSNPLAYNTVDGVLTATLGTLQAIIAIIAIIAIVIGGILYMTAAGDEGKVKTAKMAITAAIVGLALGIAAPSFLKQIGDVLGWGAVASGPVAAAKTLSEIATSALNFLLSVVGIIAVIMLVVGGMMYMLSAGDEKRMDTGKQIVKYAIIGIAVTLGALVVVTQVARFF